MSPSASSPRIGRGTVDPALTSKNQIACPADEQPGTQIPREAVDSTKRGGTRAGDDHREAPEAAPRAEALDAEWQSAIDAATD